MPIRDLGPEPATSEYSGRAATTQWTWDMTTKTFLQNTAGTAKNITVGTTAPSSPLAGDIWIDTN